MENLLLAIIVLTSIGIIFGSWWFREISDKLYHIEKFLEEYENKDL